MTRPHQVVIVGGGTAGWMAANLFAHHFADSPVELTLIESPDIGTVGVGEGSTPTLKRFFECLAIPEHEWMPACHATYKVNIRFDNWSPASGTNSYSHPFISQLDVHSERAFHVNCLTRRLGLDVTTTPDKFLFNGYLARHALAPVTPPHFPFRMEYGYHFDSGKLGTFLKERAIAQGIRYVQDNVAEVHQHPDNSIASVLLESGQQIEGDLFIDCTGFRSLLLQQTLKVPFQSFSENLFNDAAVVIPTAPQPVVPVETRATALSHGWAWQIPLTHRTGNGYVYSSAYCDATTAEHTLRQHLGLGESDADVRHLSMRVGQTQSQWAKNCLGLGLSQSFIEPLEATALHLVQTGIELFLEHYHKGDLSDRYQSEYNATMHERVERVRDYIVAHYKLNSRDDTAYWRDNRNNMALSESLLQLLDVWFRKGDLVQEIKRQGLQAHFSTSSWHCLLAGYGAFPPIRADQPEKDAHQHDLFAQRNLAALFDGCRLNFRAHNKVLSGHSR
ncbi:tryptophan halogenase family protein [Alteromonas halophila]|uniref:Tryptophan halogenase n=1 Tax=Alteromonas halophila TaxID=516698 RepID=A0A918JKX0_9ALTE|nr:tryptophan halogenase family protein [Alteromonas halophila]GGW87197.1 tryptophan halogenase [Alteromonas halophila]